MNKQPWDILGKKKAAANFTDKAPVSAVVGVIKVTHQ